MQWLSDNAVAQCLSHLSVASSVEFVAAARGLSSKCRHDCQVAAARDVVYSILTLVKKDDAISLIQLKSMLVIPPLIQSWIDENTMDTAALHACVDATAITGFHAASLVLGLSQNL